MSPGSCAARGVRTVKGKKNCPFSEDRDPINRCSHAGEAKVGDSFVGRVSRRRPIEGGIEARLIWTTRRVGCSDQGNQRFCKLLYPKFLMRLGLVNPIAFRN